MVSVGQESSNSSAWLWDLTMLQSRCQWGLGFHLEAQLGRGPLPCLCSCCNIQFLMVVGLGALVFVGLLVWGHPRLLETYHHSLPCGFPQLGCFTKPAQRISRANQVVRWSFIYHYIITEVTSYLFSFILLIKSKLHVLPIFNQKGSYMGMDTSRENHETATLEDAHHSTYYVLMTVPSALICITSFIH